MRWWFRPYPYRKPGLHATPLLSHPIWAGAAGLWTFQESAGATTFDHSGYGRHATFSASAAWGQGLDGPLLTTPGSQYASVADDAAWDFGDFTFLMRLRFDAVGATMAWLSHSVGSGTSHKWFWGYDTSRTAFHINNNGSNEFVRGNTWSPAAGQLVDLAIKKSGLNYTFFRDGAIDGTATGTLSITGNAETLKIGHAEGSYTHNGQIAYCYLFDAALDDGVILSLMDAPYQAYRLPGVSLPTIIPPTAVSAADTLAVTITEAARINQVLTALDAFPLAVTESVAIEANPIFLRLLWDELVKVTGSEVSLHLLWHERHDASELFRLTWHEIQTSQRFRLAWREIPDLLTPFNQDMHRPVGTVTIT